MRQWAVLFQFLPGLCLCAVLCGHVQSHSLPYTFYDYHKPARTHDVTAVRRDGLDRMLVASVEKPTRPDQFDNLGQLHHYLERMKQYYSVLSRPRYGRSVDRIRRRVAHEQDGRNRLNSFKKPNHL